MNSDELQDLWANQSAPLQLDERGWPGILVELREAARKFDRMIFWRDVRECLAAAVLVIWFGMTAWERSAAGKEPWLCWGAMVLPMAVIAYLLTDRARHRHLRPVAGAPLVEEMQRSIARLRHQECLLRGILWWYILPLALSGLLIGLDSMVASGDPASVESILGCLVLVGILVVVNLWIYRLNQRAVREQILPEITRLEAALLDFSTTNPPL